MARPSQEVRRHRLSRLCGLTRAMDCEAMALAGADWFEWASNHPVRELAWERPFLLVVTADGRSIAFIAEQSRHHVAAEVRRGDLWVDAVHFYAETPFVAEGAWTAPRWAEMVAETLKAEGLGSAGICVDTLSEPLGRVTGLLPDLRLQACGGALRGIRGVKHPEELAIMRAAADLSDWAMEACRDELAPGRLLGEIDAAVSGKLSAEAARRHPGEDFVVTGLSTLSGPDSAAPKGDGAPNGKVLQDDAVAMTTVSGRLNGLAIELARLWLVGRPPARVAELYDIVVDAQEASIDALVAGRPVSGIHVAAQRVFERAGVAEHFRLRAGHGIGAALHDFPADVPFNDRPLEAGETYAVEPGLYLPDLGGFRFADTLAVGTDAPERLTKAPKQRARQMLVGA